MNVKILINASYFVAALLFILGLKGMSSPVTARRGIVWSGVGMVLATMVTFAWPGMGNYVLMMIALGAGGSLSWWSGRVVKMTDMPQMVALYNGMGGGAAAAIAAIELAKGEAHVPAVAALATLGGLIGTVSFSGSLVAFAKLQGIMRKAHRLPAQNAVNMILAALTTLSGIEIVAAGTAATQQILIFFALPSTSRPTSSKISPASSVTTAAPVNVAISSKMALRLSPNAGALTAHTGSPPLSLLTTSVANASPSISSAMIRSGL